MMLTALKAQYNQYVHATLFSGLRRSVLRIAMFLGGTNQMQDQCDAQGR
jgi:hypothetical protein